jgi:putative transposase
MGGEMLLNEFGLLVENEWRRLEKRFGHVVIGDFIFMPNHMHGIVCITEPDSARPAGHYGSNVGAGQETTRLIGRNFLAPPLRVIPPLQLSHPQSSPASLGTIVGSLKSTTAPLINSLRHTPGAPVWQRNYYERIIRDEGEWARIHAYIAANPGNWQNDEENR